MSESRKERIRAMRRTRAKRKRLGPPISEESFMRQVNEFVLETDGAEWLDPIPLVGRSVQ